MKQKKLIEIIGKLQVIENDVYSFNKIALMIGKTRIVIHNEIRKHE